MPARVLVAVVAVALLTAARYVGPHLYLNSSPSMRTGLYWLASGSSYQRGDVVIACAPPRFALWAQAHDVLGAGPCGGVETVIKRVLAASGDKVRIDATGVTINGQLLEGSAATSYQGKPVPHVAYGEHVLRPGEVLLVGDRREKSFDGRYWGATSKVLGRVYLIPGTGGG